MQTCNQGKRKIYRAVEYALLFILLPALVAAASQGIPVLLYLWVLTLLCLLGLWRDPTFERRQFWNAAGLGSKLRPVLLRFAALGLGILVVAWLLVPDFWRNSLLLRHPRFWAILMLAYPLLSVYPQGIVYRCFILHRYRDLFPGTWPVVMASAFAFSFTHLVFHNWVAPALALLGGLLFARTYQRTRSLLASSLEHALYGCWIFTIGLGHYFYSGTQHVIRALGH